MYAFILVCGNKYKTGMCSQPTETEKPERYLHSGEPRG